VRPELTDQDIPAPTTDRLHRECDCVSLATQVWAKVRCRSVPDCLPWPGRDYGIEEPGNNKPKGNAEESKFPIRKWLH
jgi:hypothetical protein